MKRSFKINHRARRDMLCPNGDPDERDEEYYLEQKFEARQLEKMENGGEEE